MTSATAFNRLVASAAAASLTITPVLAKSANTVQDLVGARAGQAEGTLGQRGWSYVTGSTSGSETHGYWWNAAKKDCIKVTTRDGRYAGIEDASASDCNQKSSSGTGTAVAVGVIGAAAIAAALLSRKSKDRPNDGNQYQPEWQQVEVYGLQSGTMKIFRNPSKNARVVRGVGEGTVLRNFGCDQYEGESWCEVATVDGRVDGWARDRYLRPTQSVNPGYPGGGNDWGNGWDNNWGGSYRGVVQVYGLQSGSLKIMSSPSKDAPVVARVGTGTRLRSLGCQSYRGDNWCEVTSINGRSRGWARERYLRRI